MRPLLIPSRSGSPSSSINTEIAHYRDELHHHLNRLESRIDQLEEDWWKEGE